MRARLLTVLGALLLVAFTVFGVAQYDAMRRAILGEVDQALLLRAQAVVREVEYLGADRLDAAHAQQLRLAAEPLERAETPEVFVQVLDAQGVLVASSENVVKLDLPLPPQVTKPTYYDYRLAQNRPLRLMAAPVLANERPIGVVVVGQSLRLAYGSLRQAVSRMLAVGAVALSVTIPLMGLLLGRGLAPLQRVADTAAEIVATGDMARRVSTVGTATEVEKVAEAFNAVVARVERQLEAQRRLLADTSHELGNPLTVLRTDLSLLSQELDPELWAETVAEADREAERMGRLVDELLQLSAADVSPLHLRKEPLDLGQLAADVVSRLRTLAGSRQLLLKLSTHPPLDGDRERLGQVLTNLLDNAIRHTSETGEIVVSVSHGPGIASVCVSDDGVGIAPEHLPHLFERFYRVDRARSRTSGGTGLGLAIALMIAQAHGGGLRVESTPGQGSKFTLDLPLNP